MRPTRPAAPSSRRAPATSGSSRAARSGPRHARKAGAWRDSSLRRSAGRAKAAANSCVRQPGARVAGLHRTKSGRRCRAERPANSDQEQREPRQRGLGSYRRQQLSASQPRAARMRTDKTLISWLAFSEKANRTAPTYGRSRADISHGMTSCQERCHRRLPFWQYVSKKCRCARF
jgi:hypothetical protein